MDLAGVRRAIWMVDLGRVREAPDTLAGTRLSRSVLTGGLDSYPACHAETRRLRGIGAAAIFAYSAALKTGEAAGYRTDRGLHRALPKDGGVMVLFGPRPELVGWQVCADGRPNPRLLASVRPL